MQKQIFQHQHYTNTLDGVQTVKTCVLYMQKFTEEKKRLYDEKTKGKTRDEIKKILKTDLNFDYPIFMGTSEFIGYEPSGRSIASKDEKTDLDLLLTDYINQQILSKPKIDLISFARANYDEKPLRRIDQIVRHTKRS